LGRTFAQVFPQAALVKIGPVDYLLLGFVNGKGLDWSAAQKNLAFARESRNVTFPGVNFLVHLILTEDLQKLFGPGLMHTDNHPRLEFAAPMKLFSGCLDIDHAVADRRRLSPNTQKMLNANRNPDILLDLVEFSASANAPLFNVVKMNHLGPEQQERYKNAVSRYCSQVQVPSYGIFSDLDLKEHCAGLQIHKIQQRLSASDSHPADYYNLGLALIAANRSAEAITAFQTAVFLDPTYEPGYLAMGLLLAEDGKLNEAALCLSRAIELAPHKADPYKFLGMVELRMGAFKSAIAHLSSGLALTPDDPVILSELEDAFRKQGRSP
jgi:spermidine synthase